MDVGKCRGASAQRGSDTMSDPHEPIQEIRPVQCVSLHGLESGVADDAAEFFFGSAINSKLAVDKRGLRILDPDENRQKQDRQLWCEVHCNAAEGFA